MDLVDSILVRSPLAARMRPVRLDQFVGQEHILATGRPLRVAIESAHLHSMIFWGPPGTGKTTLARMMAQLCNVRFEQISAVLAGVKDIRDVVQRAQESNRLHGPATLLFVDEVHRFNKGQQDAFLPYVENGTFILVGATTENPAFELNNALLSRARVYKFRSLTVDHLVQLLNRTIAEDPLLGPQKLCLPEESARTIALAADGDGRRALNLLELAADLAEGGVLTPEVLDEVLGGDYRRFDKGGDLFYEQISALHKAVRGSSPDAAIYWFTRMIDGGCDPLYIARRMIRMASEDVGNADPRAVQLCVAAFAAQERLGSPEGHLSLAQAVIYLAVAPKSNAVYTAHLRAQEDVDRHPSLEVPLHLRNASSRLQKQFGYGADYRYAHDFADAFVAGENYLPAELAAVCYYQPVPRGLEIKIGEKLRRLEELHRSSTFQRYAAQGSGADSSQEPED